MGLLVLRLLVFLFIRFFVFLLFFLFFLPPDSVYGGDFPLVNLVNVLPIVLPSVFNVFGFTYNGGGSYASYYGGWVKDKVLGNGSFAE